MFNNLFKNMHKAKYEENKIKLMNYYGGQNPIYQIKSDPQNFGL